MKGIKSMRSVFPRKWSFASTLAMAAFTAFAPTASASERAFGFGSPTAGSPNTYIDFDDDNCTTATTIAPNGFETVNEGVVLYGAGSIQGFGSAATCSMTFNWTGTMAGALPVGGQPTTATVTPEFTITVPADVNFTCTLTVYINGAQESQIGCSSLNSGVFTLPAQTFPLPGGASSYRVVLVTSATWTDTQTTTFSVNVPGETSIDLNLGPSTPTTPAPPALMLTISGLVLLGLMWLVFLRRKTANRAA
jgi:hypothetical protein